jgi:transposase
MGFVSPLASIFAKGIFRIPTTRSSLASTSKASRLVGGSLCSGSILAAASAEACGQLLEPAALVRCSHESAGKKQGTGGNKIGNAHLKWAFSEAACLLLRESEQAKKWLAHREKKHGKARAPSTSIVT